MACYITIVDCEKNMLSKIYKLNDIYEKNMLSKIYKLNDIYEKNIIHC